MVLGTWIGDAVCVLVCNMKAVTYFYTQCRLFYWNEPRNASFGIVNKNEAMKCSDVETGNEITRVESLPYLKYTKITLWLMMHLSCMPCSRNVRIPYI